MFCVLRIPRVILLLLFQLGFLSTPCFKVHLAYAGNAEVEKKQVDFYAVIQSGGYLGLVSLGTGFTVKQIWDLNLQLGFTPAELAGENITQASVKTSLHPFAWHRPELQIGEESIDGGNDKIEFDPIYLGFGLTIGIDDDLFLKLPSQYPEAGYYAPTAQRWFPFVGSAVRFKSHEIFVEYSVSDIELMILVREHDELKPEDFFKRGSLSLGYLYHF